VWRCTAAARSSSSFLTAFPASSASCARSSIRRRPAADGLPPGLPVVASAEALPADVDTVFVCETRTEIRWRIARRIPAGLRVASPDDAKKFVQQVPLEAWIPLTQNIYPIPTPDIDVQPGLDMLLIELPARGGVADPVGLSYVTRR